jgi:hypothetical protein
MADSSAFSSRITRRAPLVGQKRQVLSGSPGHPRLLVQEPGDVEWNQITATRHWLDTRRHSWGLFPLARHQAEVVRS